MSMCAMAGYIPGSHYGHLGNVPFLSGAAAMGHPMGYPIPCMVAACSPTLGLPVPFPGTTHQRAGGDHTQPRARASALLVRFSMDL